jgi:hypothetical protein
MGYCAVRDQAVMLAILVEIVFRLVEDCFVWKHRRWNRHCATEVPGVTTGPA